MTYIIYDLASYESNKIEAQYASLKQYELIQIRLDYINKLENNTCILYIPIAKNKDQGPATKNLRSSRICSSSNARAITGFFVWE